MVGKALLKGFRGARTLGAAVLNLPQIPARGVVRWWGYLRRDGDRRGEWAKGSHPVLEEKRDPIVIGKGGLGNGSQRGTGYATARSEPIVDSSGEERVEMTFPLGGG